MSRTFGPVRQIAFMVRDIDAAMRQWTEVLGIGPFHVKRRLSFDPFIYHGREAPSPTISLALANSGALQVELIEQHCDTPSIYRDYAEVNGAGLQHVAAWTDKPGFDALRSNLTARGYAVVQECMIPASGVRLCYFATDDEAAPVFEIADLLDPGQLPRIEGIRADAEGWDGTGGVIEVDR